jgi:hypothetical protein
LLITYFSGGPDRELLLERCRPASDGARLPSRLTVLKQLVSLSLTDDERYLNECGYRSRRQSFEASVWYGFCYHGFREGGENGCQRLPTICEPSGQFTIRCHTQAGPALFSLEIPRNRVKAVVTALEGTLSLVIEEKEFG